MADLKPCADCEYQCDCSWGFSDNIKDRYCNIRDGKDDCWAEKEG
jgi:hypothetical protein